MSIQRQPSRRLVAEWRTYAEARPNDPEAEVTERFRRWFVVERAKRNAISARARARAKGKIKTVTSITR